MIEGLINFIETVFAAAAIIATFVNHSLSTGTWASKSNTNLGETCVYLSKEEVILGKSGGYLSMG
jgi:hypothetical protein